MYTLLLVLYIVVCIFLILVVLLQQGKGADVAAAFGGGTSQASFGPRGSVTLMHKLTTGSFVLFVALCIGLSVLTARRGRSVTSGLKRAAARPGRTPAAPAARQAGREAPSNPAPRRSGPAPRSAFLAPARGRSSRAMRFAARDVVACSTVDQNRQRAISEYATPEHLL